MLVIVRWWSEAFQSIKVAKDFSWVSLKKGSFCLTWAAFFWFISVWSSNVDDNPFLKKQLGRNKNKLRWDIYRPVCDTVQPKHKTHQAATMQQIFFNVCLRLEVLVADTPTDARLCRRGSSSSAGIWRCIKAGERDALQVFNWISCWISGTSLKCMWASPNDALIFALQRHCAYVWVVCLHVFFHQLAQAD